MRKIGVTKTHPGQPATLVQYPVWHGQFYWEIDQSLLRKYFEVARQPRNLEAPQFRLQNDILLRQRGRCQLVGYQNVEIELATQLVKGYKSFLVTVPVFSEETQVQLKQANN